MVVKDVYDEMGRQISQGHAVNLISPPFRFRSVEIRYHSASKQASIIQSVRRFWSGLISGWPAVNAG